MRSISIPWKLHELGYFCKVAHFNNTTGIAYPINLADTVIRSAKLIMQMNNPSWKHLFAKSFSNFCVQMQLIEWSCWDTPFVASFYIDEFGKMWDMENTSTPMIGICQSFESCKFFATRMKEMLPNLEGLKDINTLNSILIFEKFHMLT